MRLAEAPSMHKFHTENIYFWVNVQTFLTNKNFWDIILSYLIFVYITIEYICKKPRDSFNEFNKCVKIILFTEPIGI